ncbi:MAG: class I SAM-dependent methyltransferase [Elusimicrobia bacterium]|nr:class I SAM-dependent methyltransferase [Elusimicrobiota bacterium]
MNDDMKLVEIDCLCGARDFSVVYERPYPRVLTDVDFNATTDRFDAYGRIVRCRACGHVYTNPRPEPGLIEQGYAESEDPEYGQEAPSRAINAHLCLATIRGVVSSGRLLEVGCAAGYFLNAARTDFEVFGVEPSRWAAAEASRRFGVKVHAGTLAEAAFPDAHFDVAAMVDVIEHLADPAAVLAECRRVLRPGGLLYLVTPDIGSLSAKVLRGSWWGLRPAHLHYFSRKTLSAFLEKNGFETRLCRSYGRMFTLDYWSSRLKNYPALVRAFVEKSIGMLRVRDKFVYINTRDSIEVVARKA